MRRGQQRVQETADEFSHTLHGGMGLRARGRHQKNPAGCYQRIPSAYGRPPFAHALMMPKRKPKPMQAITPPPACTTALPHGQRVSKPSEMPLRCNNPVAMTKPTA